MPVLLPIYVLPPFIDCLCFMSLPLLLQARHCPNSYATNVDLQINFLHISYAPIQQMAPVYVGYAPIQQMAPVLFQGGSSPEEHIRALNSSLQHLVYESVCRSLFKADRLMFAMHMVHGMSPDVFKENVRNYILLTRITVE